MTQFKLARVAAVAAGIALAPPAAAQTVGVNSAVVNTVQMTTDAQPTLHAAAVRERVSLGREIRTGAASRLQVLLLDRSNFQVGANARITVDRFVYDPARSASAVGMSVARGAFRFMSGRPTHANPGQSSIRTPVATIGIRGTIVEGVVGEDAVAIARAELGVDRVAGADAGTASLILLRGPGAAAQGTTAGAIDVAAGGRTVPVERAGFAVFVGGADQPPIGPFELSAEGHARLSALLGDPRVVRGDLGLDPRATSPITDLNLQGPATRF